MNKHERCLLKWIVPAVITVLLISAIQSVQETFDIKALYSKAEYMIPMRDGVKSNTLDSINLSGICYNKTSENHSRTPSTVFLGD